MFIKASALVLALVALVNAAPQPNLAVRTGSDTNQCNTGSIQCCTANYASIKGLFGNCSPITLLGTGSGSTCTQSPVCCQNVENNGIGFNCVAINVNP